MTLIKNNLLTPTTSIPLFFSNLFTKDFFNWEFPNNASTNTTLPTVNIIEHKDGFTVEMAAPGMNKKDFLIELNNETLLISSQNEKHQELKQGSHYTRREFNYQAFKRSFHLPKTVVDESKIKAKYENGILQILIPKREEIKSLPARRIAIT